MGQGVGVQHFEATTWAVASIAAIRSSVDVADVVERPHAKFIAELIADDPAPCVIAQRPSANMVELGIATPTRSRWRAEASAGGPQGRGRG
jgi:hypothetical protein